MTSALEEQKMLLAEAALLTLRAYRKSVLVEFLDGQAVRLENLSWSHDESADYAEVIGNVAKRESPEALRFFTNEIAYVKDPKTEETIFRLPADFRPAD